jgi:cyclic 2,3-diphosphoglycerate synthetase
VVAADADPELLTGYLGLYRVLLADLVVVTMVEQPLAESATAFEAVVRELAAGGHPPRRRTVVHTVFRPVPLEPIFERRVFLATTASGPAAKTLAEHFEREHGVEMIGVTNQLGNRQALVADLLRMEGAEVLVTELKAAAVDMAAASALERGMEVVFYRNEVRTVGGDGDFDDLVRAVARQADERHTDA